MRSMSLLAATLAVIAAVGACTYRNEDLNRVVDPYWSKEYFSADNEWYLRSTVVDAPPEHGWISIADGDWLMLEKIRWEITEKFLIGWRTYAEAPGSENELLPGANELYRGQAVAIYPIVDHFDIRRDFDASSGEQANTIGENRDRLWFDRAFMRVDWASNQVSTLKFHINLDEPGYCGGPCIGTGQSRFLIQAAQDPGAPKRWRFEPDYFEITTRHEVAPDILGLVGYYGIALSGDFSSAIIDVRHSYMKVPKSDYVPLPMPPSVVLEDANGNEVRDAKGFAVKVPINDRFGYFGSLGRNTFDANRGLLTSGQVFNASRFNIWKKNRHADGSVIPLEERDAKPEAIVYYGNVDHPKQLLDASREVARQWNKAFRETVWRLNEARYTGALDADGIPSDVEPNLFVFKENDCNVADVETALKELDKTHPELVDNVTRDAARTLVNNTVVPFDGTIESVKTRYDHANSEIDGLSGTGLGTKGESFTELQNEEAQSLADLERICSALEYWTTDDITTGKAAPDDVAGFHYERLGDTRYSMMDLIVGDFQSGWLGLGPPYSDPQTAETISGTANVAIAMLDRYAARSAQFVQAINGESTDLDFLYGFDLKDYTDKKLLENSKLVTRKASQQTTDRLNRQFQSLNSSGEMMKEASPGRGDERMMRIAGSELEQKLITPDDVAMFGAVDPAAVATMGLDDAILDQVSPLRNPTLRTLGKDREARAIRMGMRAMDPPEMIENLMVGQAIAYKDMSYGERFKRLRKDIYIAVMLHEVGHNTGLFHNFAASTDALNYGKFFWELQDLPQDIGDAVTALQAKNTARADELVGQLQHCQEVIDANPDDGTLSAFESTNMTSQDCLRQAEGVYSSIMDYHGNWNADFNGLGTYDFAATKFAYGQLIETFPEGSLVANVDQAGEMKENLFYNNWRDIPEMFTGGSREEKVAKMYDRSFKKMEWNTSSTRQAPTFDEVPYRFGYGAYPEPTVKVFDFGPDTRTNSEFLQTQYYQHYFFSHFARNRLWDFDAVSGAIGADDAVFADYTEKMQWLFFYRATDPKFAGTYTDEDFTATAVTGMNHFAHVLAEPNSGDYHTLPNFQLFGLTNLLPDARSADPLDVAIPYSNLGFCDALNINTAGDLDGPDNGAAPDRDVDVMNAPKPGFNNGTIPLGEGRPFFVGFTDDYVDFYIRYVGHFWTKQQALVNMAIPYAYFPRVDADSDYRAFDVGWYRMFPKEVSQLFYNIITQNDLELGGFLDANGNYVRPDIIPTAGTVDTTGMTRVLPQIATNHNYYGYILANIFMASPTDDTLDFTKTMQIAIDGATDDTRAFDDAAARDATANCVIGTSLDANGDVSTDFSPPVCKTELSFTHPVTGLTIHGLKVGEFPVAFDLVKRLNLLKNRFERLQSCQEEFDLNGTATDPYCACITNIGYGRESAANGGDFVSTCLNQYVSIQPGESRTDLTAVTGLTNITQLTATCTQQDLSNRVESAREALDDLTDYVNDLRTYNKLINNF